MELNDFRNNFLYNYTHPSHPIAFSGINQIYNYYNGKIPKKKIEDYLTLVHHYPKHREAHKLYNNPFYAYHKRKQIQADLFETRDLSKHNSGINYILTVIDIFTRKTWLRACKNKSSSVIVRQFESIIKDMGEIPQQLLTDKGSEFKSRPFRELCKEYNIKQLFSYNDVGAPYVERVQRTIQNIIYKYMTENNTSTFIDKLQELLLSYNNRLHSSIKMTPNAAELPKNQNILFHRANKRYRDMDRKHANRKPKYKIGDFVRLKELRNKFARGYKKKWTSEIFIIVDINQNMPIPRYSILDLKNEKIIGTFYEYELSKTERDADGQNWV